MEQEWEPPREWLQRPVEPPDMLHPPDDSILGLTDDEDAMSSDSSTPPLEVDPDAVLSDDSLPLESDDCRVDPYGTYNAAPAMSMTRYLDGSETPPHPFVWTSQRQGGKRTTTYDTLIEHCKRVPRAHIAFGGHSSYRWDMAREFERRLRDEGWWLQRETRTSDHDVPPHARWSQAEFRHPAYAEVCVTTLPQADKDFGGTDRITVMRYSGLEDIRQVGGRVVVLMDPCFVGGGAPRPPLPYFQDTRHYDSPPWFRGVATHEEMRERRAAYHEQAQEPAAAASTRPAIASRITAIPMRAYDAASVRSRERHAEPESPAARSSIVYFIDGTASIAVMVRDTPHADTYSCINFGAPIPVHSIVDEAAAATTRMHASGEASGAAPIPVAEMTPAAMEEAGRAVAALDLTDQE